MPQDLTDSDVFTDPIVAPVGTDVRNVASVVPSFQGLANRTRNLLNLHNARAGYGGLRSLAGGSISVPHDASSVLATWWDSIMAQDGDGVVTPSLVADGLGLDAGTYAVHCNLSIAPPSTGDSDIGEYTLELCLDGVDQLHAKLVLVETTDAPIVHFGGIVTAVGSQVLDLRVTHETAGGGPSDVGVVHGALWVQRMP